MRLTRCGKPRQTSVDGNRQRDFAQLSSEDRCSFGVIENIPDLQSVEDQPGQHMRRQIEPVRARNGAVDQYVVTGPVVKTEMFEGVWQAGQMVAVKAK